MKVTARTAFLILVAGLALLVGGVAWYSPPAGMAIAGTAIAAVAIFVLAVEGE